MDAYMMMTRALTESPLLAFNSAGSHDYKNHVKAWGKLQIPNEAEEQHMFANRALLIRRIKENQRNQLTNMWGFRQPRLLRMFPERSNNAADDLLVKVQLLWHTDVITRLL